MRLTDIFPRIPPVRRLVVTAPPVATDTVDFYIWLRALQGLVNRSEPHLYVVAGERDYRQDVPRHYYERHWLDYYRERFAVPVEEANDVDALLERYKSHANGYVLWDYDDVPQTQNLAITRCGIEGLLPVAASEEHWMQRHGIPKRDDLRGRFTDDWDAAEWAVDNLWPHCYHRFYANLCIHRPTRYAMLHELEDYIVYLRGFACDLPASRQRRRVLNLYRRLLDSAEAPGVQMNWHCIFDQEKEYVAEAAKRGFFSLCSTRTPNLTIHGGVGDIEKSYAQPLPDPETCRAEKGKVYVCLYNSDGDATWAMNNLHSGNWLVPQRGEFKFGWGFLPLMVKLMPGMLQYYQETKTPNDCFWGPSSGAGYTYTHLWPEEHVGNYLSESRRLLDQTGQNGVNMVNWYLQDWWREVNDEDAVRREQEALRSGPGLICGLGGSPYATSRLDGPIPKVHSVHIANVGRNTVGDIVRFSQECPTRPLFMFLFAQISVGIWAQIEGELAEYAKHPEIAILSMDEFFLTLRDAQSRGLIGHELYEKTPELAETWLKKPSRHRLPICESLAWEMVRMAHLPPEERRKHLADAAWTELVSREIEGVARDRERFLSFFAGRTPFTAAEEADALLYTTFTVAWVIVRAAIESQGVYANHRLQCIGDFRRLCGNIVDVEPFDRVFAAWDTWEEGVPSIDEIVGWIDGIADGTRKLRDTLGPDESEAAFTGWPPRAI